MNLKLIISTVFLFAAFQLGYSQSDGCSAATNLTVTANCSSPVSGTTAGATQTIAGCVGTADDDVWYKFTATATSHQITVTASSGFDPVVQLFSGDCSSLASINCMDQGMTGEGETIFASGLTIGTIYTIRVYHYYSGSGTTSTFTICVTPGSSAPANDNCTGATLVNVNTSCSYTNSTTVGATQSQTGCAGNADDDIWFKFVATSSVQTITVDPSSLMDPVLELFSGTCASLTSLSCMDIGFTDGNEQIDAVGLITGNTYYVRVYDYYSSTGGAPFQICVTGAAPAVPANDEPCAAINWPTVTSECNYLYFTSTNATASASAPAPSNCENFDGTANVGGYSASSKDVWFKITVPATGKVCIIPLPGYGFSDAAMALYSGSCGSLTQISCSDDHNYPGTDNDMRPYIFATGLTPGSFVFLRYWAFGSGSGNFAICVSTPANDNCSNNSYICDLNNYSGTTSAAYTIDRPCNMRANAEEQTTYNYTPGICQDGIFGLGGAWGTGAPACDVRIDNNSWIRFTAANTSATLTVNISNCFKGNYPTGGIQMQIFSASTACCGFAPVSDFKEGSSQLTITANNLTIGQDYYLMIDGYGGDICNYSISATGGVQFPGITTANSSICIGQSVTLNGPAGASTYAWSTGSTSSSITVTPLYSQTYYLEVTGVCGDRQYLSIPITVNNLPVAATSSNSPVCEGKQINLTASGGSTYSWSGPGGWTNSSQNPSRTNATTTMAGSYAVTVTSAAGCTSTSSVSVSINTNPTPGASSGTPYCENQTIQLNGSGGTSYLWSGPGSWSSSSQNPSRINSTSSMAGTYYITVTNSNGCTATTNTIVTVNSNPVTSASNTGPYCIGETIELTTSPAGLTSYSWSGPSWTSSGQSVTRPTATTAMAGTYSVTATNSNNCSATTTTSVTVYNNPTVSANNTGPYCPGETIELNATGGTSYLWSGPASYTSSIQSPTISSANSAMGGTYYVTVTDANTCTAIANTTVTINNSPVTNAGTDVSIANGTSTNLSGNASGGTGTYTYSWSPTNLLVNANLQNPQTVNLTATSTFTLTVTDSGTGCTSTDQVVITVTGGALTVNINAASNEICTGGSIQLNAQGSGGSGTYTYLWSSLPAGFSSNVSNPIVSPTSTTTTYYVTVNDGFNNATNSFLITVNPLPTVTISNTGPYCSGETIELEAGGGNSYLWSGPGSWSASGAIVTRPLASTTTDGAYFVTVTNNNGCTNTSSTEVTVNLSPVVSASNTGPYCAGETITLNANGGTAYSWSGPDSWTSTDQNPTRPNSTLAMPGNYSVTITDANTCTAISSTTVIINVNPNVDAGNNVSIPYGTNTILNSSVSGGSGNYSYSWSPTSLLTNTNVSNPQTTQLTVTTVFTITVTDTYTGCTSTDNVTVTVTGGPLNLNIGASQTTICVGQSVQLDANVTGGTGSYSYSWSSIPSGFSSTQQSPVVSPTATTTYIVTVSDGFNTATTTSTITVNSLPSATASNTGSYCADGDSNIELNSTGGVSYFWAGPSLFTSTEQNPIIIPANISMSGLYSVTVTNSAGCTTVATTIVEVFSLPIIVAESSSNYCDGDTIFLNSTGANTYIWSGPNGFSSNEQNPSISNADTNYSGNYIVTGINNNNCFSTDTVDINYPAAMEVSGIVSIDPQNHMGNISTNISGGTEPYSYLWPDGTSTENISGLYSGNYTVTITSANLCSTTQMFRVEIPLIVPNTITPNNDGKNDDFEILNINAYQEVKIQIFTRWGDVIFNFNGSGSEYLQPENRWKGVSNGKKLPMGSYLYIITLDELEPMTGSVLIKY